MTLLVGLVMFLVGALIGGWLSGFIPGPSIYVSEPVGFVAMTLAALVQAAGLIIAGFGIAMWVTS